MAGGPAYLLVPGLFGQYYPCYLWNVRQHFQKRGAEVRISTAADGEAGVGANAAALAREIVELSESTWREVRPGGIICLFARSAPVHTRLLLFIV